MKATKQAVTTIEEGSTLKAIIYKGLIFTCELANTDDISDLINATNKPLAEGTTIESRCEASASSCSAVTSLSVNFGSAVNTII